MELAAGFAADASRRAQFGQFFTPSSIARFMASLFDLGCSDGTVRLLDAGAGNGMLIAAMVARVCGQQGPKPKAIAVSAWEIDPTVLPALELTIRLCRAVCEQAGIAFYCDVRGGDFIRDAAALLGGTSLFAEEIPRFDAVILNPPYRKLRSDSEERALLSAAGIETSNLYAAFVWLATELLADGGELVAITPRSYMNGSYFRPFRKAILRALSFRRVHVYESRSEAFGADDVLQENAIIHAVKSTTVAPVVVTTSQGPEDEGMAERTLDPREFVLPNDRDFVMHIVPDENEAQIGLRMRNLPHELFDLGIAVSTGRVVEFRARDRLRIKRCETDAPLVFPRHLSNGFVEWPLDSCDKPNAILMRAADDPDLMPRGWYVVVKRFSAKEEKRRVVAAVCDPRNLPNCPIGFENKLNVLHRGNAGLSPELAKGLALFLNSTVVDSYFRQFSGHTQVNARDLRALRFPDRATLERLGRHVNGRMPSTEEINQVLREELPSMAEGDDPIASKAKIRSAIEVLERLDAPKAQRNERSALTLLALLDLGPADTWSTASSPLRGVTEVMDWMRAKYGKNYAPNTRETIRRFTLHQFVEMGLVLVNPDNPQRPTNSPLNVYQIEPAALELMRLFGADEWAVQVTDYLDSMKGKSRLREAARAMSLIPVTLPDGQTLHLSPGGQNILIKEIIEQFAPRFTPGGRILYVGDSGDKHLVNDEVYLGRLGVTIERHGRMPDVVVHYTDRDWLVLVEAVTSHGPVSRLRHAQLKDLFAGSKPGLVFVTAFLDRQAMREYLPDIAWETEVWIADAPSHLIHFNGSRFLGPYEQSRVSS